MVESTTHSQIEADEARECLQEHAERWGSGFSVDPDAIVARGQGRGPRPPKEAAFLRKMIIFEARREGHSRAAIATALGIHEKTVLRHENDAKARMIQAVQRLEFSVPDAAGNIHEYIVDVEIKPEPTATFFNDLRRAKEEAVRRDGIKRAGPRQVRRRRAAASSAEGVTGLRMTIPGPVHECPLVHE